MISSMTEYLAADAIHCGDSRDLLEKIEPDSVSLSIWSPPYHVGKEYEKGISYSDWQTMLADVICLHAPILKPGAFLAINIADILCFQDDSMPRIMAKNVSRRKSVVTKELILTAKRQYPAYNRVQLAKLFNCSEQTIDRRLNGNNTNPEDLVIDCFIGSGTTAVAAIKENRHYIGIDKVEAYVDLARHACKRASYQSSEEMQMSFTLCEKKGGCRGA